MLAMPSEERNQKDITKHLMEMDTVLNSDEFKNIGNLIELRTELDQVKANMDKEAEEIRRIQRSGLAVRGNAIVIPGGKQARLEMMKDGRCFMNDETAMRFGASMAEKAFKLWGKYNECPQYIKDIAEDVRRSQKDLDPNVDTAGGHVIPDESRPELIRNVEAMGKFYPQCRRLPLVTLGTTNIVKRTAGASAYWTPPSTQGTRSTPGFSLIQITPEKLMVLIAYPNEFERSTLLIDLGNFLGLEIVTAMAYALDDALINGDGSATYGGITGILQSANISSVAAAATHTTLATLNGTDISNAIGGITVDYGFDDPRWGLSLSTLMKLRAIRNTDDLPVLERANGQIPANVDGYEFEYGSRMPAAGTISAGDIYAFFGNLRVSHIVGMLRDIQIAESDHALFESDMKILRGIMHVDIQEAETNAIVTAKTAAA